MAFGMKKAMLAQALAVLEAAQVARTVSAPLRLASAALYGLLGAPEAAAASLAALNVKNIQVDTISGRPPSAGQPPHASVPGSSAQSSCCTRPIMPH